MSDGTSRTGSETEPEPDEVRPGEPLHELPPDVPEADAIEQHQPTDPEELDDERVAIPADVPEADALDQSRIVPVDDEFDA